MKNSILFLASILLLTVTILSGCQTSATNVENTEDKVQEVKKDLKDSKTVLYQARQDSISDYIQFKKVAEMKIIALEKNIADFEARIAKEKKEVKDDYEKKLLELENKYSDLKKELEDYKDDGQNQWISFTSGRLKPNDY